LFVRAAALASAKDIQRMRKIFRFCLFVLENKKIARCSARKIFREPFESPKQTAVNNWGFRNQFVGQSAWSKSCRAVWKTLGRQGKTRVLSGKPWGFRN
jgi:hypothetical protein